MLTLYSVERGIIGAGIRGVKKPSAKLKFAAQPFCFAEYLLSVNGERITVIGATELESFYNLRLDIPSFYMASSISEYLLKCAGEESDEPLFMLAINALKKLNFSSEGKLAVLADFLLKALDLAGYGIKGSACEKCSLPAHLGEFAYFDFEKGVLLCEECAYDGATRILTLTAEALQCVLNGEPCEDEKLKYLLKFLNYYLGQKQGEILSSIDELLQMV
jgi:DNA repair protein RecO